MFEDPSGKVGSRPRNLLWGLAILLAILLLVTSACGSTGKPSGEKTPSSTRQERELVGKIEIDGSSTVYPITEAVAEEFHRIHPRIHVTVGISGTGGGFKRFTTGETDINDASRPIKDSERRQAAVNKIEYVELPIAYDGLSVVVNPGNDWVDYMTIEELKDVWEPGSSITHWNQIRPEWPNERLTLYGPGTDSGTFDYFTETIVGEEGASRSDYAASEDDNVLVQGIAGDKGALGYFGYAYYVENTDKLKVVAVDGGSGPVVPSEETIINGTYQPLSRPIFIYVSKESLERPEVRAFVEFYLKVAPDLAGEVGYVPMPQSAYDEGLAKIKR